MTESSWQGRTNRHAAWGQPDQPGEQAERDSCGFWDPFWRKRGHWRCSSTLWPREGGKRGQV